MTIREQKNRFKTQQHPVARQLKRERERERSRDVWRRGKSPEADQSWKKRSGVISLSLSLSPVRPLPSPLSIQRYLCTQCTVIMQRLTSAHGRQIQTTRGKEESRRERISPLGRCGAHLYFFFTLSPIIRARRTAEKHAIRRSGLSTVAGRISSIVYGGEGEEEAKRGRNLTAIFVSLAIPLGFAAFFARVGVDEGAFQLLLFSCYTQAVLARTV